MGESIHVVVLAGGFSSERNVSLATGKGVQEALRQQGYRVGFYDVQDGFMNDFDPTGVDVGFLALHGEFGEDGGIQALLERLGLPYTGSGVEASRLAMNKVAAKERFARAGLRVARHVVLSAITDLRSVLPDVRSMGFPLIVKPVCEGSSIGLSLVRKFSELEDAVELACTFQEGVMVEQFIPGRELTVGILGDEPLPVIQIRPHGEDHGDAIFDYTSKYDGKSQYDVPAKLPPDLFRRVQEVGQQAHRALGCRDVSRVDMRLESWSDEPVVLEVNTIPGMTSTSLLPKAAACVGIRYADVCDRLVSMALARAGRKTDAQGTAAAGSSGPRGPAAASPRSEILVGN